MRVSHAECVRVGSSACMHMCDVNNNWFVDLPVVPNCRVWFLVAVSLSLSIVCEQKVLMNGGREIGLGTLSLCLVLTCVCILNTYKSMLQ